MMPQEADRRLKWADNIIEWIGKFFRDFDVDPQLRHKERSGQVLGCTVILWPNLTMGVMMILFNAKISDNFGHIKREETMENY